MEKKIIECEYLNVNDILIKTERRTQEKHIMTINKKEKEYYVYINYNGVEYPLHLADYQRDFKNATKIKANQFVKAIFENRIMSPSIQINFREIEGCVYGCIVDGQQRITLIGRIKTGIAKTDPYGTFSTWSVHEKEVFNNYKIQTNFTIGRTYDEENDEYNYVNSAATPLSSADKRKGQTSEKLQDRLKNAVNHLSTVYRRSSKTSEKYDHIYRSYIPYFYVYSDKYEIKVCTTDNKDLIKVQNYLKSLSDEDYSPLAKEVKNKYKIIEDMISSLLEENESCLIKNGKQRIANTHIVSLAFLQAIKELEEAYEKKIKDVLDEDLIEEISPSIKDITSTFFNGEVVSGKSSLTTLFEKAKPLYESIVNELEPYFS